ncbi:filamentous hemagglutinin family protein [Lysobacter sp. HA35]
MTSSNSHSGLRVAVLFAAMAQVLWPAQAAAQTALPVATPAGTISSSAIPSGTGPTVTTSANTTTLTMGSPRTILNWNSFDVGTGQTVNVVFGGSSDLLVNRVVGGTFSSIDGNVASYVGSVGGTKGGSVWLLNPNGIAVGSTGRFDVGSLLLSTAGVTDADILDGNTTFALSGSGSTGISIAQGAQLKANTGGIFVQGNIVNSNGSFVSSGTNALIGSGGMTVTFDANLSAITTLDLGAGSSQANAVTVGNGAAFTGARNLITAAGMTNAQGNVLLANPGGANDIRFNAGSVELVSRNANVTAQGVFTAPGDLTISAGEMISGNGGPTVGGNYSVTAKDFSGGVFQPIFVGTTNSFSITDTEGGISVAGAFLHAPGDLSITTTNGGPLSVTNFGGVPLSSDNGNVVLNASGGIDLSGNVSTSAGHFVQLNSGDSITQSGGVITTTNLFASSNNSITLGGNNSWTSASLMNSVSGNILATSVSNWSLGSGSTSRGSMTLVGPTVALAGSVSAIGNVAVQGNALLTGDTSVLSAGGSVTFSGTLNSGVAPYDLSVTSATGTTFADNVGATQALDALTVNGASTFNGTSLSTVGAVDLDAVALGGPTSFTVNAGGAFNAASIASPSSSVTINANGIQIGSLVAGDYHGGVFRSAFLRGGTGGVQLGSGYAMAFDVTGAGSFGVSGALDTIRLSGAVGGSATLSGDNYINSIGPFSSNGLVLRDLTSLTVDNVVDAGAGDARIEVVGDSLQINSGGQIRGHDVAVSSTQFFNQSGTDGIVATGHWVIYQQYPFNGATDYDGLDSGQNAIWGQTISTLAPGSIAGNRYVFAYHPNLTFTTIDTTKTYGTDLTGSAGSFYTVTGFPARRYGCVPRRHRGHCVYGCADGDIERLRYACRRCRRAVCDQHRKRLRRRHQRIQHVLQRRRKGHRRPQGTDRNTDRDHQDLRRNCKRQRQHRLGRHRRGRYGRRDRHLHLRRQERGCRQDGKPDRRDADRRRCRQLHTQRAGHDRG